MTRFNQYSTAYSVQSKGWPELKKESSSQSEFLRKLCHLCRKGVVGGEGALQIHFAAESKWWDSRRPYYNVWPSILGMLKEAAVDIPFSQLKLPFPSIAICLPEGELIKAILFTICKPSELWYEGDEELCFVICLEVDVPGRGEVVCYRMGFVGGDDLFSEALAIQPRSPGKADATSLLSTEVHDGSHFIARDDENALLYEAVHICCGVAILANDPKFIEPIPLNRDLMKFKDADEATKKYMLERAARNKGQGFDVGKDVEEVVKKERAEQGPHFRRPHMALFWTGKGRSTPKLQLRRGAIVNPRRMTDVPTGFMDDEVMTDC